MPVNRPASYADDVYFGWGSPCIMGIVVRISAGRGRAEPRSVKRGGGGSGDDDEGVY